MNRIFASVGAAAALALGVAAGMAEARHGDALQVFRTDMVGFIQGNGNINPASYNGSLSGNGCTYSTTQNSNRSSTGNHGGLLIKASGNCSGIGTAELVLRTDFDTGGLDNIPVTAPGGFAQRDFSVVGKYLVIAASKNNQGTAVVDAGHYEQIFASDGFSFILRSTGVSANQAINSSSGVSR